MTVGLAWRNLWRHPLRLCLSGLAIAFATAVLVFLLALQTGMYTAMIDNLLSVYRGYAQLQAPGYRDNPGLDRTIRVDSDKLERFETIPGVTGAAPRARANAILSTESRSIGSRVVGVSPSREGGVSTLPDVIQKGRFLKEADDGTVVLGSQLADNLNAEPGDRVTLMGVARNSTIAADKLRVVGTFDSGVKSLDRQAALMPLDRFQRTFRMGERINKVVLAASSVSVFEPVPKPIADVVAGRDVAFLDWGELAPGLKQAIQLEASITTIFYAVLIVVITVIILNVLLMSVLERTREFGVLLAVGMRPGRIARMVWVETGLLCAIGIGAGLVLGVVATWLLALYGLPLPGESAIFSRWGLPARLRPDMTAFTLLTGPAVLGGALALAGLIPARRARRINPISAMEAG